MKYALKNVNLSNVGDYLKQIDNAISNFKLCGKVSDCIPYGNGHINDTFMVVCELQDGIERKYVLQAVNNNVFKEPQKVMQNIEMVTEYLRDKVSDPREVLSLVRTYKGDTYYKDESGYYWRMYDFVTDSVCVDRPNLEEFYQCAVAFGKFQRMLSNFPADSLHETIPDFHNTPKRYENFLKALDENKSGRAQTATEEIEFVKKYKDFYSVLIKANRDGLLPLRVSHNDTKSNNVMLTAKDRKALCVIDLDTIMPGFSVTDFGDAIRFGASTADEDEKDLSKVNFDIEKFRIFTKGFVDGCGGKLPDSEIMLLPEGAKMMTLEVGMRFLTDYIDGDTYFKTTYAEHNLVRCRTQFKLVSEMDKCWSELKAIVAEFCNK